MPLGGLMGNLDICWFSDERAQSVALLGGKNSSLSKMIRNLSQYGIRVPNGFATTSQAFRKFLKENQLYEMIPKELKKLKADGTNLHEVGHAIRDEIKKAKLSEDLTHSINNFFIDLKNKSNRKNFSVAVRSSATAEDSPHASFAGQLETYLNIASQDQLLIAIKDCFASLYTDRAIFYRMEKGFDHMKVSLSVGIQEMIRSDKACAGVMFTLEPESGFPDTVVINGSWGLGEYVVKGTVSPDEFTVFKPLLKDESLWPILKKELGSKNRKLIYDPKGQTKSQKTSRLEQESFCLSDSEVQVLARWGVIIEQEYDRPMDIEWAKDGENNNIYIVQARPETIHSNESKGILKNYVLIEKATPILTGVAIGNAIAQGNVCLLKSIKESHKFKAGSVLVTEMTDPDWVPLMKKASAIITEFGGRTSHAAIISRELGLPGIIGVENATRTLKDNEPVTVSCAEGSTGHVYKGILKFDESDIETLTTDFTRTKIMINIATPEGALRWWKLPVAGIGLTRLEFLISNVIRIHPMALIHPERIKDKKVVKQIEQLTQRYESQEHYFIELLGQGIGTIAASQYPNPVIIRMSDFKSNEYAELIGGTDFEPAEENPMLGFRGASRYYHDDYREGFSLECQAINYAREIMGFENIIVMIPFCRTPEEADMVLHTMAENNLVRGEKGLDIYMMAEIPSNVILATEFAKRFDGFSIGSNDLTQLILGVDRDSAQLKDLFNENHPAVKMAIAEIISKAHEAGIKVGLCGQGPSDDLDFAEFLINCGIDSISLTPDSVMGVIKRVADVEGRHKINFQRNDLI
jgi:pyruvate,water dikinase